MEHASSDPATTPSPETLAEVFGDRVDLARQYVELLGTTGVQHGLIGPREVPRLWDRHLLNSAVTQGAIPDGSCVADIGSGAGLPGLALAIARPDLRLTLVEPLQRRTRWLEDAVAGLGLSVEVVQAKAEALWGSRSFDVVTSRAVASLGELARLSLPLTKVGGSMVALKGERAEIEVGSDRDILERLGAGDVQVRTYGLGTVDPPTRVVVCTAVRPAPHLTEPVGDGPARTAARKKERRRARVTARRQHPER